MNRLELRLFVGLMACLPFCISYFPAVALGYSQYVCSFVLIMLAAWQYPRHGKPLIISTLGLGLLYLAFLIATTPILHDRPFVMSWLPALIGVISLFILNTIIISENKRLDIFTYLCHGLLIGAIANTTLGCLQWLIAFLDQSDLPVYGFINQRNLYVHYVTLGSIALAYLWALNDGKTNKWFLIAFFLAIGAALGGSRSSFLYLLVLSPMAILGLKKEKTDFKSRFFRKISWIFLTNVVALLLPVAIAYSVVPSSQTPSVPADNINAITRITTNVNQDPNRVRVLELKIGWHTFTSNPIIGVGWNGFALAQQNAMQNPPFSDIKNWPSFIRIHTHNVLLQLLVEYGVFSLPIILYILYLLWGIFRNIKSDSISAPILALLGIMLAHSMVEYPLWHFHFITIFIVLLTLGNTQATHTTLVNNRILLAKYSYITLNICIVAYASILVISLNKVARVSWTIKESKEHIRQIEPLRNNPFVDFEAHKLLLAHLSPLTPINDEIALCNHLNRYEATPKSLICEAITLHKAGQNSKAEKIVTFAKNAYPQHQEWIEQQINKPNPTIDAENPSKFKIYITN